MSLGATFECKLPCRIEQGYEGNPSAIYPATIAVTLFERVIRADRKRFDARFALEIETGWCANVSLAHPFSTFGCYLRSLIVDLRELAARKTHVASLIDADSQEVLKFVRDGDDPHQLWVSGEFEPLFLKDATALRPDDSGAVFMRYGNITAWSEDALTFAAALDEAATVLELDDANPYPCEEWIKTPKRPRRRKD